jgi:hypothetical protein
MLAGRGIGTCDILEIVALAIALVDCTAMR